MGWFDLKRPSVKVGDEEIEGPVTQLGNQRWDATSFMSEIRRRQLARSERFEVQVSFPPSMSGEGKSDRELVSDFSIYCEEVQIPGMVLTNKEFNLGPWTHYRNNNIGFLGNEINLTFYCDVDWRLREQFERWMAHCVDPTSKQVAYPADTWGRVTIASLDMKDRYRKAWVLHEVTPKVLNLIPLSMGNSGIARATLIVSAAYWESTAITVGIGKPDNFNPTGGAEENSTRTAVRDWVLNLFRGSEEEKQNKEKNQDPKLQNGSGGT
jgi:hypothetical protein